MSPPETGVSILVHSFGERINMFHRALWLVAVPLQVGTLPQHFPLILRPHIRGLRHHRLAHHLRILIRRPDLVDQHTQAFNPVSEVDLSPYGWLGATALYKSPHRSSNRRVFKFSKWHDAQTKRHSSHSASKRIQHRQSHQSHFKALLLGEGGVSALPRRWLAGRDDLRVVCNVFGAHALRSARRRTLPYTLPRDPQSSSTIAHKKAAPFRMRHSYNKIITISCGNVTGKLRTLHHSSWLR